MQNSRDTSDATVGGNNTASAEKNGAKWKELLCDQLYKQIQQEI